jgi:hypothetical protein
MAGVGAVDINVQCGHVLRTIRLENVAYVPSFNTNIVSLRHFTAKDVTGTRQQASSSLTVHHSVTS